MSTSNSTGAIILNGGLGVKGNVYADAIYDGGVEVLSYLQGVDNTQNTRLTVIEGSNLSQNVRLDFSNTRMNIIDGVDVSQNARMTISDGVNASQNVRLDYSNTALTIAQGVDNSQNVRLDYSNTVINQIQSAWTANTVIVANSTGALANSNMRWNNVQNQLILGITGDTGNLAIGTTTSVAPITVVKGYSTPTGGEQFGSWIQTAYNIADTSLKQGLRLNTSTAHTSNTISNAMGLLNLMTAGGVGGTTAALYGHLSRNDVTAGAYVTNSYNYSEIWFHYCGHGSEQLIFPSDYIQNGCLSNDDIYAIIKNVKCPIKIIMDCIQISNIGLNLQYMYNLDQIKSTINLTINKNKEIIAL
jgi:hypothetical protein